MRGLHGTSFHSLHNGSQNMRDFDCHMSILEKLNGLTILMMEKSSVVKILIIVM